MSIIDRLVGAFSPSAALKRSRDRELLRRVSAIGFRREGAASSPNRKAANQVLDSPDSGANHTDRLQIIREARFLEENSPIFKSILRKYRTFVVGRLQYVARTKSDPANIEINAYVERWMKHADRCGRHHFRTLAGLGVASMKRDGDVGFIISEVEQSPTENALRVCPIRLQPIEADRIGATFNASGTVPEKPFRKLKKGEQVASGVVVDADGRPVRYLIYNRQSHSSSMTPWKDVDAENFILLSDSTRLDGVRGVSICDASANDNKDLREILECEKVAVKYLSSIAGIVKNATGEPEDDVLLDTSHSDYDADAARLKKVGPGEIRYLAENEDFMSLVSDRPSTTFNGFTETLIRSIGLSAGLPFGAIYSWSSQGTAVRMEAAQAAREFEMTQLTLEEKMLDRIVQRVIARGIQLGHIPPVPDWDSGEWRYPAKVTADVGRESKAVIDEVMAGITSRTQVAADRGEDRRLVREFLIAEQLENLEDAKRLVAASGGELDLKAAMHLIERRDPNAPVEKPEPAEPVKKKPKSDDDDDEMAARPVNGSPLTLNLEANIQNPNTRRNIIFNRDTKGNILGAEIQDEPNE